MTIARGTFTLPFTAADVDELIREIDSRTDAVTDETAKLYMRHLLRIIKAGDTMPREEWHRQRELARDIPIIHQELKTDFYRLLKIVKVEDTE